MHRTAAALKHGARTARGAVLRTEATGFMQGYHGRKAGLTLGTEDRLSGWRRGGVPHEPGDARREPAPPRFRT